MNKTHLRKRLAEILGKLTKANKEYQSKLVQEKVLGHPKYKEAKNISIYLSTDNEIDTIPILRHALEIDKKQCFVPLVRKKKSESKPRMLMVKLSSMREYDGLPFNHYGIKEHDINNIDETRLALPDNCYQLDLVLVPGVAFSRDGRRLGHGKGYYDEFLFDWLQRQGGSGGKPYTLGLALQEQIVEDPLSVREQDYALDEVLTS